MNFDLVNRIKWHTDFAYILKLSQPAFKVRTYCECGVGPLDICNAVEVYKQGLADKIILVEPNPELAGLAHKEMPKADIWRSAIAEEHGTASLRLNGGSSYIDGRWSPATTSGELLTVSTIPFRCIDTDGSIDAMTLDCEGMEWVVLKDMTSRPKFLSVEVWASHPDSGNIFRWLNDNKYLVRFTTGPEGETYFCERQGD